MKNRIRIVRAAAFVIAGAMLFGAAVPGRAQTATLNIEAILPMTGPGAFGGQTQAQSFAAFEKYVNAGGGIRGTQIHVNINDDQSSPQVALQLTNALVAKKVPVIFGSSVIATCSSIGAAVAATGPVQLCLSSAYAPPKSSYSFAPGTTIVGLAKTLMMYAKNRGFHRLAFIAATDATGIASAAIIEELAKSPELRGLELVSSERISPGDISASAQIAKMKEARPDILITTTSGTVFATVVRGLNDAGIDIPVITTSANGNPPQLKQLGSILPRDLYINGVPYVLGDALKDPQLRIQAKTYLDAFKATGVEPTPSNTSAWDPLLMLLAALRQYGPALTADQLKAFLLAQSHFAGVNGFYNFSTGDQHGLDSNAVVMIGWDKVKQDFYPAAQPGGIPIKR